MLKELLRIYFVFFRMGCVAFGGGYTLLPILRREVVRKQGWVSEEQVMDFFAVSQGLPGIVAINVSVFIGHGRRGWRGAVSAALGMVTPSLIIITLIAAFLSNYENNPVVRNAFTAISLCVCALIIDAVVGLWKKGVKDVLGIFISAAAFILAAFTGVSPVILVVAAAFLGVFVNKAKEGRG